MFAVDEDAELNAALLRSLSDAGPARAPAAAPALAPGPTRAASVPVRASLAEEPLASEPGVFTVEVLLPNKSVTRRFAQTATVGDVYAFVTSCGLPSGFVLATRAPGTVLDDHSTSLASLRFGQRFVLICRAPAP